MPTLFNVDNDVHHPDVPDPIEWQLFDPPTDVTVPPRIRISFNQFQEYGKGKAICEDDSEEDDDEDDEEDLVRLEHVIPPRPRMPLQSLNVNARSSYVRKAKGKKRLGVDLIEEESLPPTTKKKLSPPPVISKKKPRPPKPKPKQGTKAVAAAAVKKITTTTLTTPHQIITEHPSLCVEPSVAPGTHLPVLAPVVAYPKSRIGIGATVTVPTFTPLPNGSYTPLPNGSYESWINFVDNGGYKLTADERSSVKRFVQKKRTNPVAIAEGVKFHRLVKGMRSELINSARDAWDLVLPPKSYPNFDFCCLFLMIATPAVTDDSIILVFGPLFRDNCVTPRWVLEEGELGIANRLRALGRQTMTARYIVSAATNWNGMPRDYRQLSHFLGVGPKISLVCVAVCFGDYQGSPCDVHMVRIFKALGWMAVEQDLDESLVKLETARDKKGKSDNEYEVARACIEGWFPKTAWGELNQTWAGLGQLLNKKEERKQIAEFVDLQSQSWTSNWRQADRKAMSLILKAY